MSEIIFNFKSVSNYELQAVFKNASNKLGVNEAILEKDYWVCFILNFIFNQSQWRKHFTFKEGTSLSKCYGLIKRFSEDIDLILDWRALG